MRVLKRLNRCLIKNNMAIGKCLRCNSIEKMTEDHVIPQWFQKQLPNFGIAKPIENAVELVCEKCNMTKGGKIDFSYKPVREVMKKIIDTWIIEYCKHEVYSLPTTNISEL